MFYYVDEHFTDINHESILQSPDRTCKPTETQAKEENFKLYSNLLLFKYSAQDIQVNLHKQNSQTKDPQLPEYFELEQIIQMLICGTVPPNLVMALQLS